MKRDGTFTIEILGDKEIAIHPSANSYDRLYEDDTVSDLARMANGECSDLLIATTRLKEKSNDTACASGAHSKPKLDFAAIVDMAKKSDIPCEEDSSHQEQNKLDTITVEKRHSGAYNSLDKLSGIV